MNPYTNYYDALNRQTNTLITDIQKAIDGEYSAINCYSKIANLARSEEEKNRILEIRKDEVKHYQQFQQIYTSLTGTQHQAKITEACPNTYTEGLEFALQDEQKTVDFYMEIADDSTNQFIKDAFKRAAVDEQNHAVWFLYFYTKAK